MDTELKALKVRDQILPILLFAYFVLECFRYAQGLVFLKHTRPF